jgi:serine/threonine protein kinase
VFNHALNRDAGDKEYLPLRLVHRAGHQQVETLLDRREQFEKRLERFRIEARRMAMSGHPVLRETWQHIKENSVEYIVMPFYAGKTLRQKVHEDWRIQKSVTSASWALCGQLSESNPERNE